MNAWLKRCVFNLDLNRESVSEPRTFSGRLFHSLGARANHRAAALFPSQECFKGFQSTRLLWIDRWFKQHDTILLRTWCFYLTLDLHDCMFWHIYMFFVTLTQYSLALSAVTKLMNVQILLLLKLGKALLTVLFKSPLLPQLCPLTSLRFITCSITL